jgi:RNA polymerase sigma-70 factor (ECF subfamily)
VISPDDLLLVRRIADGDTEAENNLFLRLRDKISLLVRIRLRGKIPIEDYEDVVSEVYNAILVSLRKGGFKPELGYSIEAYIAGIAGNVAGQYFRKQKKIIAAEDIDRVQNLKSFENILSDMITEERNEKLRKYLRMLKPKYQEILLLRIYEERSIEEISNMLNLEKRRVSERINYAFKLLLKECKKDKYFQYYQPKDK